MEYALMSQDKESKTQRVKLKTVRDNKPTKTDQLTQLLASAIAHELNTPLSGIKMGVEGLEKYLPKLIDTYVKAQKHDLIDKQNRIPPQKLNLLYSLCDRLKSQAENSLFFIKMALTSIRDNQINKQSFKPLSIKDSVNNAIAQYPLTEQEKSRIIWKETSHHDFTYWGDPHLTKHVLFNLIKNALFHTQTKPTANISITTSINEHEQKLIITDTGVGIPPSVLPNVFTAFYTSHASGSGVGLAFCKLVLEAYGGNITCQSKPGEYTVFTLVFPKS